MNERELKLKKWSHNRSAPSRDAWMSSAMCFIAEHWLRGPVYDTLKPKQLCRDKHHMKYDLDLSQERFLVTGKYMHLYIHILIITLLYTITPVFDVYTPPTPPLLPYISFMEIFVFLFSIHWPGKDVQFSGKLTSFEIQENGTHVHKF